MTTLKTSEKDQTRYKRAIKKGIKDGREMYKRIHKICKIIGISENNMHNLILLNREKDFQEIEIKSLRDLFYNKNINNEAIKSLQKRITKVKEKVVSDKLAQKIGGIRELRCTCGRIDVIDAINEEIIEVKRAVKWKEAIKQINRYSCCFPNFQKRIHLFGKITSDLDVIKARMKREGIRMTYEP